MNRGDVWRVRLAQGRGHAQSGIRPAVLVQDDAATAALPTMVVIPFTTNLNVAQYPGTVVVQPGDGSGLTLPSVAMTFQITVLDQRDCLVRLGTLDSQSPDLILEALDRLMGR